MLKKLELRLLIYLCIQEKERLENEKFKGGNDVIQEIDVMEKLIGRLEWLHLDHLGK